MQRRAFLRIFPLLAGIAFERVRRILTDPRPREIVFHVAGARFFKVKEVIRAGDAVQVKREYLKNIACYELLTSCGEQIGYVPRQVVSSFEAHEIVESRIESVADFAVPWHRYKVRVRLQPGRNALHRAEHT